MLPAHAGPGGSLRPAWPHCLALTRCLPKQTWWHGAGQHEANVLELRLTRLAAPYKLRLPLDLLMPLTVQGNQPSPEFCLPGC